VTEFSEQSL